MQLLAKGISKRILDFFYSPYKKVGIGFYLEKKIKHTRNNKLKSVSVCKKNIMYKHDSSFIHSLEEIFFNEIYKCNFGNKRNLKIIDCGSNIGMSVLYLKLNYPEANIEAFEPDTENFKLLSKNTEAWGFNNINIHNSAIWVHNDSIQFVNEGDLGSKISLNDNQKGNTKSIKSVRLNDMLNENIDLLKIDIEGAEFEVIKDCKENLKNVSNLFLEYHGRFQDGPTLLALFQIIESAGFKFYIKEAANLFPTPFYRQPSDYPYEVQLNIFAFRN